MYFLCQMSKLTKLQNVTFFILCLLNFDYVTAGVNDPTDKIAGEPQSLENQIT